MIRKIVIIDQEKCNGCGACVNACHEGAIGMRDGKAVLLRDDYCDGLGDCLPACPTDAISFEVREALPYDEGAVLANIAAKGGGAARGCPGSMSRTLPSSPCSCAHDAPVQARPSRLAQWPVQIRLAPANAPWLKDADLLVAADCSAFAHGDFHETYMKDKVTVIGCPKLDPVEYAEKLTQMIGEGGVRSVQVARMSVPCCSGLAQAAAKAVADSGKDIPFEVVTLTPEGKVAPVLEPL